MTYVDGFVLAVPTANMEKYHRYAEVAAAVLKKHGASNVVECWGDDVPKGELTDFYRAVQARDDETIVFSWITWPDKETRDAGMEKAMGDPIFDAKTNPMPLDGKRMIFGGFRTIIDA
ncbi:MAG: DUF1428 domain-containing protein [Methyloceanibacter sp.]|nr:DUF1428 domain-containing protein [Methyloceanibacter sp.]